MDTATHMTVALEVPEFGPLLCILWFGPKIDIVFSVSNVKYSNVIN